MGNNKKHAREWAEKVLAKQPIISHEEIGAKLQEFMILGRLLYDDKGNWMPQLNLNQSFEVKYVKVKNGKIIL